jgi:xylulokinase
MLNTHISTTQHDEWLLGLDIGTGSVKALAMSREGRSLACRTVEHPMHRPRPGWAENDPDDWVRGVAAAVRLLLASGQVDTGGLLGISLVSQRDPWVLLDDHMRPLAPTISWTDRRSEPYLAEIYARIPRATLIERTGVLPIPGLGLPNLVWTQHEQPDVWSATRHLLSPKDYVLFRLTGLTQTDISMPTRSVMNDIHTDSWSAEICAANGIDMRMLPEVAWRPWECVAELSAEAASTLGLRPGVPVAAGGADDPSATLGAGAIGPGDLCAGTGTSSDWRMVREECAPDSRLARGDLCRHVVPDRYIFSVCIESTGSSLRWFRDAFPVAGALPSSYVELVEEARQIPPGADGLTFLPFVDGSNRAPWFLEGATGGFLGIVSGHTHAHFVRALLEGIAYQYPPTLELLCPDRAPGRPITLVDGESRSDLWNQIKADVIGVPIRTAVVPESAALGAVILAGQAAGEFDTPAEGVRDLVRFARVYEPDPVLHERYNELRRDYAEVFAAVRGTYRLGLTSGSLNGQESVECSASSFEFPVELSESTASEEA